MEENDKKQFLILMLMLGEAFKEEISKERGKIYFEFLSEFTFLQVKESVRMAIKECPFFPRVAQLRDFITNPPRDREKSYLRYLEANTRETLKTLDWRPDPGEAKSMLRKLKEKMESTPKPSKPSPVLEGDQAKRFEEKRKAVKKQFKERENQKKGG